MAKFDDCLCHIKKKAVLDNLEQFSKIVNDPHFICASCMRVANKKKNLCKPKKLR